MHEDQVAENGGSITGFLYALAKQRFKGRNWNQWISRLGAGENLLPMRTSMVRSFVEFGTTCTCEKLRHGYGMRIFRQLLFLPSTSRGPNFAFRTLRRSVTRFQIGLAVFHTSIRSTTSQGNDQKFFLHSWRSFAMQRSYRTSVLAPMTQLTRKVTQTKNEIKPSPSPFLVCCGTATTFGHYYAFVRSNQSNAWYYYSCDTCPSTN